MCSSFRPRYRHLAGREHAVSADEVRAMGRFPKLRVVTSLLLEQDGLVEALERQSAANADQMSVDAAIQAMAEATSITMPP
jgi:hypothetical protein